MKLELVNEPLRTTQRAIIVDLEDTMITIGKRSHIFPVIETQTYETIGYYLIGDIYLGSDTIINTTKGAVGSSIEKLAREAFIKSDTIDFSNTKADKLSDRDFRKVEIKAYRQFEKIYKRHFNRNGNLVINSKRFDKYNKIVDLEFYTYLFDPEEFILIKDNHTIIAISSLEKEVIVCDKKKNSYIEVSKDTGVQIHNNDGQVVDVGSTGGVIINGKNLKEVISGALKPLSNMFDKNNY